MLPKFLDFSCGTAEYRAGGAFGPARRKTGGEIFVFCKIDN